jgi:hypothetical protein
MNKLIIVEGPDCCGKTTLAEGIRDRYGAIIIKARGDQELWPDMTAYHDDLLDEAEVALDYNHVVLDRHWISELVYRAVINEHTVTTKFAREADYNFVRLQKRIADLGGLYILCRPTLSSFVRHEQKKDPNHPYSDEQYAHIVGRYLLWFSRMMTLPNVVHYNLDNHINSASAFDNFIDNLFV